MMGRIGIAGRIKRAPVGFTLGAVNKVRSVVGVGQSAIKIKYDKHHFPL